MLLIIKVCLLLSAFFMVEITSEKFRVCVVDGRGGFKRASKYCPILDNTSSKVECVIGTDRLDCLRRISKGTVDFSVFTPEDLVTATNSEVEVLITNQMKFTKDPYEYEVVAVINNESGIESKYDLKDKKLCHPGYGYETDWTNILANFLEASVIPQSCDENLTLTENRIKSSSKFFKSACKAGPWVNDIHLDQELKMKYHNLCELCDSTYKCDMNDKYWGRRGPLYCLTDGAGDISWSRLDDVKVHFGLSPGVSFIPPEGFSYLCQDGSIQPLNSTTRPCVWVVKPWAVIASKRKVAMEVQDFINSINQESPSVWESALLNLIQNFKQNIVPLDPVQPIENYLENSPGFLSANSFSGCHPPRTIRVCTTSNIANSKCSWMREAAAVYSVEPDLDCIKAENITQCMDAIHSGIADIVFTPADFINEGIRNYNLETILYETVDDANKYITVAVVKKNSGYKTLDDLKGSNACFPSFDGIAWNSAIHALGTRSLIDECPAGEGILNYFNNICAHGASKGLKKNLDSFCHENVFDGEYGALRCLNGPGDVAFMSKNNFDKYFKDPKEFYERLDFENFRILYDGEEKPFHFSWATPGQAMILKSKKSVWVKEAIDVFLQLDNLFGKNYKSVTTPFTMFGLFSNQKNILFPDYVAKLRTVPFYKNSDKMIRHYDNILRNVKKCYFSSSERFGPQFGVLLTLMITFLCL